MMMNDLYYIPSWHVSPRSTTEVMSDEHKEVNRLFGVEAVFIISGQAEVLK